MLTPKVGLVTVSLSHEETELASKWNRLVREKLEEADLEVMGREKLSLNSKETLTAARELREEGVSSLIFLLGTWVQPPQVVSAVKEVSLPFVLWGLPDAKSFSLTGAGATHGALDEMGIRHKFVYGSPEDTETIDEIVEHAKAAMAVKGLSESYLGKFGGRTGGMYTATADMTQVRNLFGVEYNHVDQYRLVLEAQNFSDEGTEKALGEIRSEFGEIGVPDDVLERSARLYLALKKVASDDGYDFTCVKCMPEVSDNYCSFCLAVSLANDDGIVTSCECDVNAALTMQILKLLAEGPVLFGDVNYLDKEEGILRLVNCGSMASGLAKSREDVDLSMQYEYLSEAGGATTTFCCKPGRVTLARLSRIEGEYVMQIATGEAIEYPKEKFKEARGKWPHAFIRLDGDWSKFSQNCRSNHQHMVYGDVEEELLELCKILGIEPIQT